MQQFHFLPVSGTSLPEMAGDEEFEYCVLWFKNSKGESVASIVTPVRKGARGSALPTMVQRDKNKFSNEYSDSAPNTFEKPLIGDDALIGKEFLLIPERKRGDADEKALNYVAAEDATQTKDATDIVLAAPMKPSPKVRQNRNSTRAKEAPNTETQKSTRPRSRSARPREVQKPNTSQSDRSRSRSARPQGLSEQNLNQRLVPTNDNGKKKRHWSGRCVICKMRFDHEVKLSGHMNMMHTRVPVEKPYECRAPGCTYR